MDLVCHGMDVNSWESRDHETSDPLLAGDEYPHDSCAVEEWDFRWWSSDGDVAGYTSYRLHGRSQVWYCWGLWRRNRPLLHVTEFDITRRSNPMIAKASALWAEYTCDAPFEQWTLGNETYAVELDDPEEALGRAYGKAVPIASDLEWYATSDPVRIDNGYTQEGRLLGTVETVEGPLELADLLASRTHRWSRSGEWVDRGVGPIVAHLGPRLPFRFPDGTVRDLYLTPDGLRAAASL